MLYTISSFPISSFGKRNDPCGNAHNEWPAFPIFNVHNCSNTEQMMHDLWQTFEFIVLLLHCEFWTLKLFATSICCKPYFRMALKYKIYDCCVIQLIHKCTTKCNNVSIVQSILFAHFYCWNVFLQDQKQPSRRH